MNILTLDVGTSSAKAAVWTGDKMGPVARVAILNMLEGVRAEISPAELVKAAEKAVRDATASAKGKKIDALAFDVFSPGVLVTDARGKPRTPIITHADRRSVEQSHAIEKRIGRERILKLAGNRPVPGGIGSSTLRWLSENTGALSAGARVAQASTFLLHQWTVDFLIDYSQAAFLGLWDITTGQWNDELCHAAHVPAVDLPEVLPADMIMGSLTSDAAKRLGLPEGLPILGGLVDTSAAIIAADLTPGTLIHNAGSTDVLALVLAEPHPALTHLTRPLGTGAALAPRWLATSTIAASGSAIAWIRETFFRDLSDKQFLAAIAAACKSSSTLSFSPHLAGDRTSIDQLRAQLTGLTLATTREEILAALIAGLVEASTQRFTNLSKLAKNKIRPTIHTMGGAHDVGEAMHRAWPDSSHYKFKPIEGEALRGLKIMAEAALDL
jgi:xylulokinase